MLAWVDTTRHIIEDDSAFWREMEIVLRMRHARGGTKEIYED